MTELKTLKNLEVQLNRVHIKDLKQEAIKWIYDLKRRTSTQESHFKNEQERIIEYGHHRVIDFIKHFFNITEGDLE